VSGAVSLATYGRDHAALLAEWLRRPHVARWHPDADDRLKWALNPPPGGSQALIACKAQPIGYLRWQKVTREALDSVGLFEIPAGSVDIDILIGQPDSLGLGLGPKALSVLIDALRSDVSIPVLGLSPSVDNVAAQRAYAKAGFRKRREYDAPGLGRLALMLMRLDR
jgi:aminoglycoside 6'-N-acetyltransferase